MDIVNINGNLHDKRILSILSYSQYHPTEEKMNRIADQYEREGAYALAYLENQAVLGVIVLRQLGNSSFEIRSIAVDPARRGQGIASKLIHAAIAQLSCSELRAETDDDAVGFYRRYGFQIESLGEKYPGTVRYLCTWKPLPAVQQPELP